MKRTVTIFSLLLLLATGARAQVNSFVNQEFARVENISLRLDVFTPSSGGPFPTLIFIHGGGWNSGGRGLTSMQTRQIQRGYAVASIDYRLSQQAKFPAQIHDVKAAIRYLRANAARFNLDADKFALWGQSAGGHLAAIAAASSAMEVLEDLSLGNGAQSSKVRAVFDLFGPTDLLNTTSMALPSCPAFCFECAGTPAAQLIGGDLRARRLKAARANPIRYVQSGFAYPAFLIFHGTNDCTVPPMQSQLLRNALLNVGANVTLTSVPGAGHFAAQFETPALQAQLDAFFDTHLRQ